MASVSAGPGTRANIDEFTKTTSKALEEVGGADRGKAIMILNPADPPLIMRDTIFCSLEPDADEDAVTRLAELRSPVANRIEAAQGAATVPRSNAGRPPVPQVQFKTPFKSGASGPSPREAVGGATLQLDGGGEGQEADQGGPDPSGRGAPGVENPYPTRGEGAKQLFQPPPIKTEGPVWSSVSCRPSRLSSPGSRCTASFPPPTTR